MLKNNISHDAVQQSESHRKQITPKELWSTTNDVLDSVLLLFQNN